MIRSFLMLALLWGASAEAAGDAPEISRSRGRPGGAVVLWPRVVPEAQDPALDELAAKLQQRLEGIALRTLGERRIQVRPRPERVCPLEGCRSVSLGVLLGHQGGGCVAVALVGPPGAEPMQAVPWAGTVELAVDSIPFRQPPEAHLTVREFTPCADLLLQLDDPAVEAAVRSVVSAQ